MNHIVTIATTFDMATSNHIVVTVSRPGFGAYTGGTFDQVYKFRDEAKARDYYTDMLLRYPNYEVTFNKK